MDWLTSVRELFLGDPLQEGLVKQQALNTYEALHAEAQSILIATPPPRGLSATVQGPVTPTLRWQGRLYLDTGAGDDQQAMMAALFGGGAQPKKDMRRLALGGVWKPKLDNAKLTLTSLLDNRRELRAVALLDPSFSSGPSVRVLAQALMPKAALTTAALKGTEVGVTAVATGADYAASIRGLKAPAGIDVGVSYHQRLAPGSPVTLGGEMFVSGPSLAAATTPQADGRFSKDATPLEWAVGASHTSEDAKTSLHFAKTSSAPALSCHHIFYLNKTNTLVAKAILNPLNFTSMAAIGCKLQGTNTLGSITSSIDTYGGLRMTVEHTPIADVKVALGLTANFFNPSKTNEVGFRISYGAPQPLRRPLSPCTMYRDIFQLN